MWRRDRAVPAALAGARATPAGTRQMSREVPPIRTPRTPEELVDILAHAHAAALGEAPGENRLRLAWSQIMLEHARGRAIWCGNIGNVTCDPRRYRGPHYVFFTEERIKRNPDVWKKVKVCFRAHASVAAGAEDYWNRMSREFAAALPFFDRGDVAGACAELSTLNYFTARVEPYEREVRLIQREFEDAFWNYP